MAIAEFYRTEWPLLIVTTASMKGIWHQKAIELLPSVPYNFIRTLDSGNGSISGAKIVICSYSGLENNMKKIQLMEFGVVIFDESHSLKNAKAKQTQNAATIGQKAHRAILLSGTPALSRPAELFPQLDIIDKRFASWFQFTSRYCGGKQSNFGWQANGCENVDELNILLSKKFMIRRTKNDVMSELGEKQREVVVLSDMKFSSEDADQMQRFAEGYEQSSKQKEREQVMIAWNQSTAKLKAEVVG